MSGITVFEVGVRDGLQNEPRAVSLANKMAFIRDLIACGIRELEVGAFVRLDLVPQMADTDEIYLKIKSGALKLRGATPWCLVPNQKGLERAIQAGAKNIAVFTAASESFAKRNIGMSIGESLTEFKKIISVAKKNKIRVRGYVSTAFGCPFEGPVAAKQALRVISRLSDLGVDQVSIGDTIGVATPNQIDDVMRPALRHLGKKRVAGHFHDTRGTALANALRAIEIGVTTLDSSAGGLGGCPFAPGARGNLATEDLVYMLDGMGIKSGINLSRLSRVSIAFSKKIKRPIVSRYVQAFASSGK